MKQRWATRCQKCIKRQLPCTARCALRKTKQARGKPLKLLTLPSLPQTLPKHSPVSCYLWIHRRSSKGELKAMSGSFVVLYNNNNSSNNNKIKNKYKYNNILILRKIIQNCIIYLIKYYKIFFKIIIMDLFLFFSNPKI